MSTTKGVWSLQEVRDQILAGEWVDYDFVNDPADLYVWGLGTHGGLGLNSTTNVGSPSLLSGDWLCVAAGYNHVLATKSDNTTWLWGQSLNSVFEPVGCSGSISSPVQLPGTWTCVSTGGIGSTGIICDNGELYVWGGNDCGMLGVGDTVHRSSPTQIPGTSWCHIAIGPNFSCHSGAIKTDGTLWMWGAGFRGRLGNNSQADRSSPIQVPGNQWVDVQPKVCWTLALKSDGTLWSWGQNERGDLGQNLPTAVFRSSPTQIPGTQWVAISKGGSSGGMARKSDGTLWTWGCNNYGQLGQSNLTQYCSPRQVPGNQWNFIAMTEQTSTHAGATKTDGTLWIWGDGGNSALAAAGSNVARSSPVQVPGNQWRGCIDASIARFYAKQL